MIPLGAFRKGVLSRQRLFISPPTPYGTMIAPGAEAPDFEAPTSKGTNLKLSSLRGKTVILYFYPKAFTSGCAMETRSFGELYPKLAARGVEVVGVSVDDAPTQAAFATDCHADFPLVADTDMRVAKSYGVLGTFHVAKRVTFYIDPTGKVAEVVESMRPGPHFERAVERYLEGTQPKN
jgi:peroxiredoxin Q/BCP